MKYKSQENKDYMQISKLKDKKKEANKIMKKIGIQKIYMLFILVIAYLATYFVPYIIHFEDKLTYTNSVISFLVFIGFAYLLKKSFIKENIAKIKNIILLGIILSSFLVVGNSTKINHGVDFSDIGMYMAILFISFVIDAIIVQIYKIFENYEAKEEKHKNKKCKYENFSIDKKFIIIFLIIFICWMPSFLAQYPGNFTYDARTQYMQFNKIGGERLTSWHPVIHTMMLGGIVQAACVITGNANVGIALYSTIQMAIIASIFAYTILFLEKFKVPKIIRVVALIYYILFPVNIMSAMCATKDVIFSALVLMSIMISIDALLDKETFIKSKKLQARFIIITFLAIIFRNNAIYAYIPFLIIFAILLKKKEILISFTIIGILYAWYVGPIYTILGIHFNKVKSSEALSVPLQQIARVYNYNYESLTNEELESIYKYTKDKQLKEYKTAVSDPVKHNVDVKEDIGYIEFFKLWLNIGIKNPRNICRCIFRKYIRILVSRYTYRWIYKGYVW